MSDVVGIQAVRSALREEDVKARCLYVSRGRRRDARINELISLARDAGVRFQLVEPAWFKRRAGDAAHQGVLLEAHDHALADEAALLDRLETLANPLLLVLDGITDPRNLGACLRTANGAGVDAVIVPKRRSAPLGPVVLKTAQGGLEGLFVAEVTNLARTLEALKQRGIWLVGADDEGAVPYTQVDYGGGIAVVMGSEGKGLRRLTREHCDALARIPMQGPVSSLNVSVAAGVLLFEAVRQRAVAKDTAPP